MRRLAIAPLVVMLSAPGAMCAWAQSASGVVTASVRVVDVRQAHSLLEYGTAMVSAMTRPEPGEKRSRANIGSATVTTAIRREPTAAAVLTVTYW